MIVSLVQTPRCRAFFSSSTLVAMLFAATFNTPLLRAADPKKPVPTPSVAPPAAVLDAKQWTVPESRGNTFAISEFDGRAAIAAGAKQLVLVSGSKLDVNRRVRIEFRFPDPTSKSGLTFAAGLADPANLKDRGKFVTITPGVGGVSWAIFDPRSTTRATDVRGVYRPQFLVERSLAWPESLRANVEADMLASKPIEERRLLLEVTLRPQGYEVSLDGIPLADVAHESLDPRGFARLLLSPKVEIFRVETQEVLPADDSWLYRPIDLTSILNAAKLNGSTITRDSLAAHAKDDAKREIQVGGIPFHLPSVGPAGQDHVDVGTSWFRQGNLDGRFSGRGNDPLTARWPGALIKDPARLTLRLPYQRYTALHLLAASDGDADEVPVVTAQFYRSQSGFPKNFAARVPAFTATSSGGYAIDVATSDGKPGRLYLVTIPIDAGALAEFADLDYLEVELTKEVRLYRASPDPMYYSLHAAGLPSSVHIYALTAERPAVDVEIEAGAYAHIWTAPETPTYKIKLRNRLPESRDVEVRLRVNPLGQKPSSSIEETVSLPRSGVVTRTYRHKPSRYGFHDVEVTVIDAEQRQTEHRSLAYLHEDTRERGNWDFGHGPLFGFWNWGGGHVTPAADKQLLAMAKAGIETTPGSFEEYVARHGEETRKVMEAHKIFTLKFAGAGDHYVTAKFAADLKAVGLEKARETFIKTLTERRSTPGPNSRPMFLSFYAEPSIGPVTHGIFPKFIGEAETPFSDYERERYEMFLNGFVEGARIVREKFPEAKNLLPHGDPAFVVHFLQNNREDVASLIDGVCVDIPCFERLPEQQFHQVSLHRLYMARQELREAGIKKPLLPMYEGPCVPSGPGALTDQEQADITIRNSLMLLVYGVDIQNGGFPAFDTASYWGEQHYGFGVLNRMSLETPKIAYTALATLTRHLNRKNFEKWLPTGSHSTYALQFKHYKTGETTHVLWTLRGTRPVSLQVPDGAQVVVYDQNDNPLETRKDGNRITFSVGQSPCYVEGLAADAVMTLGEPSHNDAQPAEHSQKLANFGDGSWKIAMQQEPGYEESHTPYIFRYPSKMTAQPESDSRGPALAIHFPDPEKDRVFVPYYSVLTPPQPIAIPGKASHLGLWVKGSSDWGRVVYFVRDAQGEQWINVGTRGAWNCDDLHSWMSFNFDGWRYLRMELPSNGAHDRFREGGSAWWGPYSSGDGNIDLPLKLEKVVVERRTHVMYVDGPEPADRSDVLLGDLFAEYETAADSTPEAVRIAAVRMSVPEVNGLGNPIAELSATGAGAPLTIERITLPPQEADGTQCYVHFPKADGATQYDVWASPYADGRGALQLGKAWKEPGGLIRGLRPNRDFYLYVTYTTSDGKTSKPSAPLKINLVDFFGMK